MTNIYLKDGQHVPMTINYRVGGLHSWKFDSFVSDDMARIYSKRKFKKTHIAFVDGYDNNLLDMIAKKNGKTIPKGDHWVEVYGHMIMPTIWKPSGKIKFALYNAKETTLYTYAKKKYPQGKWQGGVPKWVREK